MDTFSLGTQLSASMIYQLLNPNITVEISAETVERVTKCRSMLEDEIDKKKPIYGVSTGFGQLASQWIDPDKLDQLQVNLIRSHAAGMGEAIPKDITRTAMILLANSLAKGHSGIRMQTLELLKEFINFDAVPVTYRYGSLGASGDLAPLAHIALALIGEGKVEYHNHTISAQEFFQRTGLTPLTLKAKEGLALINGTHFITAYAIHFLDKAKKLLGLSTVASALSIEALRGSATPFDERITNLRPHKGQKIIAERIHNLLKGSKIIQSHRDPNVDKKVQDPYSLRCIPQVMGAVWDALAHLEQKVVIEVNSVTDNPLIFPEDAEVLSGGNFHGEPLVLPLEYATLAITEWANITERRINRLVHPSTKELPAFLASNPGLESGYMIPHYTVAAIVNRMRTLSHPAASDNIPVSGDQEDHVSMGMGSATKAYEVIDMATIVVAAEMHMAIRGLNMQPSRPKSSHKLEKIITAYNENVQFVPEDHYVRKSWIEAIDTMMKEQFLDLTGPFSLFVE